MHIAFVHTPMATVQVPERENYWKQFDLRYNAAHPGLVPMNNVLWELPHWMTWLAGVLVAAGFNSLEALDLYASECTATGIDTKRFETALKSTPADVYLLSPMTPNLPFALQIADIIKSIYPKAYVIFGGVVATPLHKEIAKHTSVDYVMFGRGELALPELLRSLSGRQPIESVGHISYKNDFGMIVTSKITYPWVPVNEIAPPKIDLFSREIGGDIRYLRQVYALGCPYKCSFCTIQTIGQKADYFAIDRVLEEIHAYRGHYGEHHNVYFGDETFTVNSERTLEICNALEGDGTIKYDIQTRLNCLTDSNILKALKRSGCQWVEIGLETINQNSQNIHKQKVKLKELEDTLKKVRDAGLATCSFVVNGFPDQTPDDMARSIDYVCELIDRDLLQTTYLFGLVPYPGSDLYATPEKFGMKLKHHNFQEYHEELPPVYETAHSTSDEIHRIFLDGLNKFGQAMAGKSKLLNYSHLGKHNTYGNFWAGSHV